MNHIMRTITVTLVAAAFIVYLIAFAPLGIGAVGFLFPFTMIPFGITGIFAWYWRSVGGQAMLLVAALAYAGWFGFVYLDALYWRPDPQSPIALLFVGIYAAPVLLLLWICGFFLECRPQR